MERWIACDLDNTICLLSTAIRRELRLEFGIEVPAGPDFEGYASWARYGVTEDQLERIFRSGDVFRRMGIRSGARTALEDLRRIGYRIAIVTDRFWYPDIGADTEKWLHSHDVPFDELALVRAADKDDWIRARSGDRSFAILFEDRLDTAIEVASVVPEVVLFDYRWNRTDAVLPANVHRYASWAHWSREWSGWQQHPPVPPGSLDRPFVVALVGLPGSGKNIVHQLLEHRGFVSYRYSDLLREEARRRGIERPTRRELQNLGDEMRARWGSRILSKQLAHAIATGRDRRIIVDGVRHPAEINALRADPRLDVFVIAVEATPEARFERLRQRAAHGDPLTWEDFTAMDARDLGDGSLSSSRLQVGLAMEQADGVVDGSGTPERVEEDLRTLLERYLPRLLPV